MRDEFDFLDPAAARKREKNNAQQARAEVLAEIAEKLKSTDRNSDTTDAK